MENEKSLNCQEKETKGIHSTCVEKDKLISPFFRWVNLSIGQEKGEVDYDVDQFVD